LLAFEHDRLPQERQRFKTMNKQPSPYDDDDIVKVLLEEHWRWVLEGDKPEPKSESNDVLPNNTYRSRARIDLKRDGERQPNETGDSRELSADKTTQDGKIEDDKDIEDKDSGKENTSSSNPPESNSPLSNPLEANDLAATVDDFFVSV